MDILERIKAARIEARKRVEVDDEARMEVERWAASEAKRVSAERRIFTEKACIFTDAALLKQRGNPPWRRRR